MHCRITNRFAAVRRVVLVALWLCGSGSLLAQTFTTLFLFGTDGVPLGTLVEGTDGSLYGTTYRGLIYKITPSGTFTALHSGGNMRVGLTLGTDGNFYGTSTGGVFRITPGGTFTELYNFAGA